MTGWTCPSCGVNYAPSVTECRCSAAPVVDDQVRKWIDEFEKSSKPLTPRKAPVLPWVDPWTPPVYGPAEPWTDPWQRYRWYCGDVVVVTPAVYTVNVDYLQLASLGGRQ